MYIYFTGWGHTHASRDISFMGSPCSWPILSASVNVSEKNKTIRSKVKTYHG